MRRLPFELYGASALIVAAAALIMRAWRRERSLASRMAKRVSKNVRGHAA